MMKKSRAILGAAIVGSGLALLAAVPSSAQNQAPEVMVYKSSTCGCCVKWVDHLRENGFTVETENLENLAAVKREHGVPPAAASCHTAIVDGYVVEGHVPADAIQRLLRDRPKVVGIAVPGMPAGSPGMELPDGRHDPYSIVTFDQTGRIEILERR